MDYSKIITRSWEILKNNKWLLLLGFLASLGGGSGGKFNFNVPSGGSGGRSNPPDFGRLEEYAAEFVVLLALLCGALLLLAIIFWILRLIGEAGLISSVLQLESKETKLGWREGLTLGWSHIKSMIGLSLLRAAPTILFVLFPVIVIGSLALAFADNNKSALPMLAVCIFPLICLGVIIQFVLQFIYPFAQRSIIIEENGVIDGIRHGWEVLKGNIGEIFLLAIIFAVIGFAFGIVTFIVLLPIIFLTIMPMIFAFMEGGTALQIGSVALFLLGVLAMIMVGSAIGSIARTLQSTAFTLGYLEWTGKTLEGETAPA